jgi:hypothetical protein
MKYEEHNEEQQKEKENEYDGGATVVGRGGHRPI